MLGLYSVKDRESETFIKPFVLDTDRDAIESFRMVTNDEKTNYFKFPNDYLLVRLGSFDPRTGEVKPDKMKSLIWAKDLLDKSLLTQGKEA